MNNRFSLYFSDWIKDKYSERSIDPMIISESNHENMLYSVSMRELTETSLVYSSYNLKIDWEQFSKDFAWSRQIQEWLQFWISEDLKKNVSQLQAIIQEATAKSISRKKACSRSKTW